MKTCPTCKLEQPNSEYNKNCRKKDGLQNTCKTCNKLSSRKHYLNNKDKVKAAVRARNIRVTDESKKVVYDYLLTHPCVDCGEDDPIVLEFDHIDPETKVAAIAKLINKQLNTKYEIIKNKPTQLIINN